MNAGMEGAFGREIHRFQEVASTNDVAFELAGRGRPEGTVVLAGSQRSGRGRRGRGWFSPADRNLYLSILLDPGRRTRDLPELSWVVAGSVAVVLKEAGLKNRIALKFPNDVLVGGKKIAGVLLENRIGPGQPGMVVAGIGLNVDLSAEEMPDDLTSTATSLLMEGSGLRDLEELCRRICRRLEGLYREWKFHGGTAAMGRLEEEGVELKGFAEESRCDDLPAEFPPPGE